MAILSDYVDDIPPLADTSQSKAEMPAVTLTTNTPFVPTIGSCYEIHFGKVNINNKRGFGSARIKADGLQPSQWIDLDTGNVLESSFQRYVVQAFREINCQEQASGTEA